MGTPTPIRPPEPDKPKRSRPAAGVGLQWFWAIALSVTLIGPLAVWLYRLAFGL